MAGARRGKEWGELHEKRAQSVSGGGGGGKSSTRLISPIPLPLLAPATQASA